MTERKDVGGFSLSKEGKANGIKNRHMLLISMIIMVLIGGIGAEVVCAKIAQSGWSFKPPYSNPIKIPVDAQGLRKSTDYDPQGHTGIDFDGYYDKEGTLHLFQDEMNTNFPVRPVQSGKIQTIQRNGEKEAGGNFVVVKHGPDSNGKYYCSYYGHLRSIPDNIKVDDPVTTDSTIADVGNTGTVTTGSHLHFEEHDGEYFNSGTHRDPTAHMNKINIVDKAKPVNVQGYPKFDFSKGKVKITENVTDNWNIKKVLMKIDGNTIYEEDDISKVDDNVTWECSSEVPIEPGEHTLSVDVWDCSGNQLSKNLKFASNNHVIPEFPTIALPVIAILGLVFLFSRRKRKE